jgi:Anti-sigma-K factor rskA, C-terminal
MTGHDPLDPAVARLLEDPAVWAEVSADLRERTLAAATGTATAEAAPVAGAGRAARYHPVLLAAAAAVVVLALVVAGGLAVRGGGHAPGVEVALVGTQDLPGASATAELRDEPSGVSVVLDVSDLPPAPDGTFYEAWLVGGAGKISAGTFHRRGDQDEVQLWLGVDTAGYDAITVTRQPVEGGTLAEGVVVLRGDLP